MIPIVLYGGIQSTQDEATANGALLLYRAPYLEGKSLVLRGKKKINCATTWQMLTWKWMRFASYKHWMDDLNI